MADKEELARLSRIAPKDRTRERGLGVRADEKAQSADPSFYHHWQAGKHSGTGARLNKRKRAQLTRSGCTSGSASAGLAASPL
jgi:hypothetical protein